MTIDYRALSEPLRVDQIDFRVQSISRTGKATILAYKDARVDMQRLDDVVGPLNWKREHCKDNHNCIVSLWCDKKKEWVSKEDTGTESFTEAQKGLASDSFKRACFNWGIGRELYDYPRIVIELEGPDKNKEFYLNDNKKDRWGNPQPTQGYGLRLKEWRWFSEFDSKKELAILIAKDDKGKVRFEWRNINLVKDIAEAILGMIAEEQWDALVEAWRELEGWEQHLLFTAKTKGGFFDTAQKSLIKEKLFESKEMEQAA